MTKPTENKPKAWRNDAVEKVTGRAKFADDLVLPNMLHAVPVYSRKYIHGTILGFQGMAEAQAVPGVVRVITAQDIPGKVYFGQIFQDYAMLALDKIRCEGDVIALVVAEDRDTALRAADLIELEVEELPTLFDSEEALKETNNLIHPSKGSNLINHHKIRRGKASRDTHQEGSTAGIEEGSGRMRLCPGAGVQHRRRGARLSGGGIRPLPAAARRGDGDLRRHAAPLFHPALHRRPCWAGPSQKWK
jgi:xanthine dehydrogenase molybdopterin-binding subunit B